MIGVITSFALVLVTIYLFQPILLGFAFCFLIICLVSYYLAKYEYIDFAIHLMLITFPFGFTISPFFGLYLLSAILIYPLSISLSIFFLRDPLKRLLYALICVIFCFVFIFKLKAIDNSSIQSNLLEESIIVFGLLSSLFIVGFNYFSIVFRYQAILEKNEQLLFKKNNELENYIDSNLQLENFAHLASHELKSPLRNILNFSQVLNNKLSPKISDQEKKMLGIISNQAEEMDQLIKDLFELSSVTNEPMKASRLELANLLSNLVKFDFAEHSSKIHLNTIPEEIYGNRTYIKEVFKNLISNAIKFVSPDQELKIEIGCKSLDEAYEFSVKDNGIGISSSKRDKVFLIFKRLHTRTEYEGTGIGLAICKKIVERHLGKIWIEDNPLGGTVFKFTIAKNLV